MNGQIWIFENKTLIIPDSEVHGTESLLVLECVSEGERKNNKRNRLFVLHSDFKSFKIWIICIYSSLFLVFFFLPLPYKLCSKVNKVRSGSVIPSLSVSPLLYHWPVYFNLAQISKQTLFLHIISLSKNRNYACILLTTIN